jgi:hypothetical protein
MNPNHVSCREIRAQRTLDRLRIAVAQQKIQYCRFRERRIRRWSKYLDKLCAEAIKRGDDASAVMWKLQRVC